MVINMKTVVGFLSRPHGLNVLKFLVNSPDYKLIRVYSHKLNPKSQDPLREVRSDSHLLKKNVKNTKYQLFGLIQKIMN